MYIYYECPDCKSEIYKEEKEFYVCQQCGHKIPTTEIKANFPDELFAQKEKSGNRYHKWMTSGIVIFLVGMIYMIAIIISQLVKFGFLALNLMFCLGPIVMVGGIITFLIGLYLKKHSKKKQ